MNFVDVVIKGFSVDKFGNRFIKFMVKREDMDMEEEQVVRDAWENGTLLNLSLTEYQQEEASFIPPDMPKELKPLEKFLKLRGAYCNKVKMTKDEYNTTFLKGKHARDLTGNELEDALADVQNLLDNMKNDE